MKSSRVIALCGLDSVGKTSLFHLLQRELPGDAYEFLPRGPKTNERLVEQYFQRTYRNETDWTAGSFARAMAMACALDYFAFYQERIEPLLNSGKILVADRYACCFAAYAAGLREPEPGLVEFLLRPAAPDLIFFVTATPANIAARQHEMTDPMHHPDNQKALQRGYDLILPKLPSRIVRVPNDGPIEMALNAMTQEISRLEAQRRNSFSPP